MDFPFECSCGERYREIEHAKHCRKCRVYTERGWCDEVIDLRTGKAVWTSTLLLKEREEARVYVQKPWVQPTLGDLLA